MNPNPPDNRNPASGAIASRLQGLERMAAEMERQNSRRRKAYLTAGIALTALCIGWLSYLTNAAFKLDAHALTQIGRLEVEKQLPNGMEGLREYLKLQAPNLVYYLLRSSLDVLPRLRNILIAEIDEKTRTLLHAYEAEFLASMEKAILASKQNIDLVARNKSDIEKLEMLVDHTAREFQEGVSVAIRGLYPAYASELDRIEGFLVNLQHKDENQLSEREMLQKEIIETLLRLMVEEGFQPR